MEIPAGRVNLRCAKAHNYLSLIALFYPQTLCNNFSDWETFYVKFLCVFGSMVAIAINFLKGLIASIDFEEKSNDFDNLKNS